MNLTRVVEALLFSAPKPLSAKEIVDLLRRAGAEDE
ncbi:MAG TPA: segregation and condensation protein B, partial [Spartobacteria bacterium]|nr:segregation and condensation protein B [Spartobacteria bacterium]